MECSEEVIGPVKAGSDGNFYLSFCKKVRFFSFFFCLLKCEWREKFFLSSRMWSLNNVLMSLILTFATLTLMEFNTTLEIGCSSLPFQMGVRSNYFLLSCWLILLAPSSSSALERGGFRLSFLGGEGTPGCPSGTQTDITFLCDTAGTNLFILFFHSFFFCYLLVIER
jgi:hypothetical protein